MLTNEEVIDGIRAMKNLMDLTSQKIDQELADGEDHIPCCLSLLLGLGKGLEGTLHQIEDNIDEELHVKVVIAYQMMLEDVARVEAQRRINPN